MDFDPNRVAKNIADLLKFKGEMEGLVSVDIAAFRAERKSSLALRYLLIETVEVIADTCQHLLGKAKGIACEGYVDAVVKAGENGMITAELAGKLRRLASLRNSLIHRYWVIDDDELYRQCSVNLNDLPIFASQIEAFVKK